jgi:hypothetical protein
VQQLGRERTRPVLGACPQPLEDRPRLLEPLDGGRVHLGPVGHAAIELGLDQRADVDAVDRHILDLAGDLDVDQLEAEEADVVEGDRAEVCVLDVRAPGDGRD